MMTHEEMRKRLSTVYLELFGILISQDLTDGMLLGHPVHLAKYARVLPDPMITKMWARLSEVCGFELSGHDQYYLMGSGFHDAVAHLTFAYNRKFHPPMKFEHVRRGPCKK